MSASEIITGTILESAGSGARLDKALAEATGLSRARVQGLIDEGRVDVAGKTATSASMNAIANTPFRIIIAAAMPAQAAPEDIPLTIAYEDAHLIGVDKPAGMVVHPAVGNITGTLVNALLHHCRGQLSGINGVARPGIVHRIDKDTSGLLVIAK
ncbi:MAG: pseudouridine synthase, partial [Erythrobacteraceae bacterium]